MVDIGIVFGDKRADIFLNSFSVRVKLRHPRHCRHERILSADPRLNTTVGKVHK